MFLGGWHRYHVRSEFHNAVGARVHFGQGAAAVFGPKIGVVIWSYQPNLLFFQPNLLFQLNLGVLSAEIKILQAEIKIRFYRKTIEAKSNASVSREKQRGLTWVCMTVGYLNWPIQISSSELKWQKNRVSTIFEPTHIQ